MGVNPKIGGFYPQKWMVKIMVPNPMNKWMIWGGFPIIFGNTPMEWEGSTWGGGLPIFEISNRNVKIGNRFLMKMSG